ncbi:MAG: hypothetical protein H6936_04460 [Burkholderiales bacterium]|nr:hypothetical protein [Burkholderiales bacterium]
MKGKQLMRLSVLIMLLPLLSGCWMAAAAGAGAYGGYKMKEKGYTVQSPITKKKESEKNAQ